MFEKKIDTSAPVHELISTRWSGVAFDPERIVEDNCIHSIAEAARWAPSCYGDQPWRYIICKKNKANDAWDKAFQCIVEGNQTWCKHAQLLIIACHDTLLSNNKENGWAQYDTGAATLSLCLQATQLGLMTHQMAGFKAPLAREKFDIPTRYIPITMIAVGYQLAQDKIPQTFKDRETATRSRNQLSSHFFIDAWDQGLKNSPY